MEGRVLHRENPRRPRPRSIVTAGIPSGLRSIIKPTSDKQCPMLKCNTKTHISKVIHHFSTTKLHRVYHARGSNFNFDYTIDWENGRNLFESTYYTPLHLELDEKHFYLELVRTPGGVWYSWVYIIGSQQEAQTYNYTLKFVSKQKVRKGLLNEELLREKL